MKDLSCYVRMLREDAERIRKALDAEQLLLGKVEFILGRLALERFTHVLPALRRALEHNRAEFQRSVCRLARWPDGRGGWGNQWPRGA